MGNRASYKGGFMGVAKVKFVNEVSRGLLGGIFSDSDVARYMNVARVWVMFMHGVYSEIKV